MSQRTVIEINHDVPGMASGELRAKFYDLFMTAIASGSDRSWEPLRRYGFTKITQCHHSEDRKVVVADREYPFG